MRDFDVSVMLRILEPIWKDKTVSAKRVRSRVERILGWAKARGYLIGDNPAAWRGHLEYLLPRHQKLEYVQHRAALPVSDIRDFMTELHQLGGIPAMALEFTILTGSRSGEVVGTRWAEINFDERVWLVPPERMKSKKEHRVPLSDAAFSVLDRAKGYALGDYVFRGQGGRPLQKNALLMVLRTMRQDAITVHGFRSTFRDWAAEQSDFPAYIVEMALAHAIPNMTEAAYRRGDLLAKRRQLLAAWATFCGF